MWHPIVTELKKITKKKKKTFPTNLICPPFHNGVNGIKLRIKIKTTNPTDQNKIKKKKINKKPAGEKFFSLKNTF